jgi:hypothetical protein
VTEKEREREREREREDTNFEVEQNSCAEKSIAIEMKSLYQRGHNVGSTVVYDAMATSGS